jgi:hypothetical protein
MAELLLAHAAMADRGPPETFGAEAHGAALTPTRESCRHLAFFLPRAVGFFLVVGRFAAARFTGFLAAERLVGFFDAAREPAFRAALRPPTDFPARAARAGFAFRPCVWITASMLLPSGSSTKAA